jgi:parallel beta-helix repeat protein
MKGYLALITSLLLLSLSTLPIKINIGVADVPIGYPVHNLNTGLNYTTIQESIDANETLNGHTILVDAGVYYENILVDKSVSLIGENRTTTMLNQTEPPPEQPFIGPVVKITADNAEIAGFNFVFFWTLLQISVDSCSNVTISDNTMSSTGVCISLLGVSNCTITRNTLQGGGLEGNNIINAEHCEGCDINDNTISNACYYGIYLYMSNHNLIRNNLMQGDGWAVYLDSAYGNVIFNNVISGPSDTGIEIYSSGGNVIFSNTMSNCWAGVEFNSYSQMNSLFHNMFERNYNQVVLHGSSGNSFDSGVEGNYWDDYNNTDANQDGIGDEPYNLSSTATDHYPLMGAFRNFTVSNSNVQIISNSTITNFQFNGTAISFSVSGEDSAGFCRIRIPTALLNIPYRVFLNGTEIPCTLLPCSDANYSYLYFSYTHSTHDVVVIPEFQPYVILLLLIATIPSSIIVRRKKCRR